MPNQYDSLGQWVGNEQIDTDKGTTYRGTKDGQAWESFVQRPKTISPAPVNPAPDNRNFNQGASPDAAGGTKTRYTGAGGAYDSAAQNYLSNFAMPDENVIREQKRKDAQAHIDNINEQYGQILKNEEVAGQNRLGQTRGMAARGGLLGSDFGASQLDKTQQGTNDVIAYRKAQQAEAISAVWDKFDQRAQDEIDKKTELALKGEEARLAYLKDNRDAARTDFATIAASGLLGSLEDLNDEEYKKFTSQTGWDDFTLRATLEANKPKASQIDWDKRVVGNTLVWSGIDPATGELKVIEKEVQLPEEVNAKDYENFIDKKGNLWFINPATGDSFRANEEEGAFGEKEDKDGFSLGEGQSRFEWDEASGQYKQIGYNPKTYKGGSGGSGRGMSEDEEVENRAIIMDEVNSIKGSDKKLDTGKYQELRERIATETPDMLKWFDATYPSENYLNPNDPTAKSYFASRGKLVEEEEEEKISEGKRKVLGMVNGMKEGNESRESIIEYIEGKGYTVDDFSDQLAGYSPQKKDKQSWWNPGDWFDGK